MNPATNDQQALQFLPPEAAGTIVVDRHRAADDDRRQRRPEQPDAGLRGQLRGGHQPEPGGGVGPLRGGLQHGLLQRLQLPVGGATGLPALG